MSEPSIRKPINRKVFKTNQTAQSLPISLQPCQASHYSVDPRCLLGQSLPIPSSTPLVIPLPPPIVIPAEPALLLNNLSRLCGLSHYIIKPSKSSPSKLSQPVIHRPLSDRFRSSEVVDKESASCMQFHRSGQFISARRCSTLLLWHCHTRKIAQLHVKRYGISDQAVQIEIREFRPKDIHVS